MHQTKSADYIRRCTVRRRRLFEKKKDIYDKCWDGYERVPGTKKGEKGSCRKKGSANETDEMEEEETLEEIRRTIRSILLEKKKKGLWDNIHAKRKRGEPPAKPGEEGYPKTLDVNEYDELMEVDEYDENAFVAKAADAKAKGKKKFKMGDKEYDVTIDKDTAEEITGEKIEEARIRRMIRKILLEACYDGRKVTLNKPMSNPENKNKKSKVYVSGDGTYKSGPCKGQKKAKKVQFGDPNMRIKKNNPKARKSFRARHNCDNPGPKDKARYWSCKAW